MNETMKIIKECESEIIERPRAKSTEGEGSPAGKLPVTQNFDEKTAPEEAGRCLGNTLCQSCDLCRLLCPDLCITRNEQTGRLEIDYDVCKGCGICAWVCPKGAIKMVLEE